MVNLDMVKVLAKEGPSLISDACKHYLEQKDNYIEYPDFVYNCLFN